MRTFLLILIMGLAFSACGDKDDDGDGELCKCNPKEHYLPCTCGGTDCTCDVKPRGYITEYQTNVQIPIYQKTGVTDTQAETTKDTIITEYGKADGRLALKGKIKEVWIIKEANDQLWLYDYEIVDSKLIIKIQVGNDWIADSFNDVADNVLPEL